MSEIEKPYEIPNDWKKSVTMNVLCYRDSDSAPNKIVRSWFKTEITYTVYNQDKYANTYLSILHTNRHGVGHNTRTFVHTWIDIDRGFSTFEITTFENSEENGIVVKVGKIAPIEEDEVRKILREGKHKLLHFEGSRLLIPYVYNESLG